MQAIKDQIKIIGLRKKRKKKDKNWNEKREKKEKKKYAGRVNWIGHHDSNFALVASYILFLIFQQWDINYYYSCQVRKLTR